MNYLKEKIINEIVIEKSRFITILYPLESLDDVQVFLAEAKKEYPKATHYCTSYIFGRNGETASSNDDGEPAGTAGVPIFESLKHANVTNVFCVVVRYYGGVKLGAGGLIRAYSRSANEALLLGEFYKKVDVDLYEITLSYSLYESLLNQLKEIGVIVDTNFLENVILTFYFLKDKDKFIDQYSHLIEIKHLEKRVVNVEKEKH